MNELNFKQVVNLENYKSQLIDGVFKTLPLMEKNQNWEKHLEGLLIELRGAQVLFDEPKFVSLISRMAGLLTLTEEELSGGIFRKTIFDSITLIKTFFIEEETEDKAGE